MSSNKKVQRAVFINQPTIIKLFFHDKMCHFININFLPLYFKMQISRAVNSSRINIRVTSKSKPRSVSRNVEKVLLSQINQNEKEQNPNLPKMYSPSRKQFKHEKYPLNPIKKVSLTFGQNKSKKSLTLSVKENNVLTSEQNNQLKSSLKQKVSCFQNLNQSSLIRQLMKKEPTICEKAQQKQYVKKIQIDQNMEQQNIKSDTQQTQTTQKFQQKNSLQIVLDSSQYTTKRKYQRFTWLEIQHQFSININSSKTTKTVETQTITHAVQDKYFLEYIRMRQLKLTSFNVIQAQQSKIKQIINSTVDFTNNYNELVQAISNGPTDDRQRRICSLSKDLTDCQVKLNQAFEKVKLVANKLEEHIENNVHQINKRKASLFNSIQNLIFATLIQLKKQRISEKPTILERILNRAHRQLKYLKDLVIRECTYSTKTIMKFSNQIHSVRQVFNKYMNVHLQNRVLQYTLIKQIEKIPALMITVFGEDKDLLENQSKECQVQLEDKFRDYMKTKCEECYHMKKKVSFLQFQNQKIKPVFKSLEWLIRDCSKNQCCLSFL